MPFITTRQAALQLWLSRTSRARLNGSDDYSRGYECNWQNKFQPPVPGNTDHYSIFCSLGDFSTNITDILEDDRFDACEFDNDNDQQTLYRHYTRTFLFASEILTDFQDILTGFRLRQRPTQRQLGDGKSQSRTELEQGLPGGSIVNLFEYINNVFKHKVASIHFCNHHLPLHFSDIGQACPYQNPVSVQNIQAYKQQNDARAGLIPAIDSIQVPSLIELIGIILNCYNVLDTAFQADLPAFDAYADLYLGMTPEVALAAAQAAGGGNAPVGQINGNNTP